MQNVRDLLAAHGTTFSDMHVTTSICGPSRASILTGQYAHHTGVLENFGAHAYPAFDGGVGGPAGVDARRGLRHRARRQVHQRLHRSCRTSQDPAGLGRLAGDGQHPDGGVLQLRPQRQRQPRPLRQQAERLFDLGADQEGRQLHPRSAAPVLPLLRPGRAASSGYPGARGPRQAREHRADPRSRLQPARHRQGAMALLAPEPAERGRAALHQPCPHPPGGVAAFARPGASKASCRP